MNRTRILDSWVGRNGLGLLALLLVHYLADWYAIGRRPGLQKVTPYLYLVLLYGWLVFHNRVLFTGLFLRGRRGAYFGWTLLLMGVSSFNMVWILRTEFSVSRALPFLVSYCVYTVTGLGVYMTYRALRQPQPTPAEAPPVAEPNPEGGEPAENPDYLTCVVNGDRVTIPCSEIHFLESLENYVQIHTAGRVYITRLTMKEAEARLPRERFLRISRSHIVNRALSRPTGPETLSVNDKPFRIGRTYQKHVLEQFQNPR